MHFFHAPPHAAAIGRRSPGSPMVSGVPGRSAGLEADEKVPRRGGLLHRLQPCDGAGRGSTDERRYRWRGQRNIVETAEVTALMVRATIAVLFGMVSVGRCLAHQVAIASMVVDARADDVRDRLDRPHQQQDGGQPPQQPMRRRSSSRAGSRAFHANLNALSPRFRFSLFAEVPAGLHWSSAELTICHFRRAGHGQNERRRPRAQWSCLGDVVRSRRAAQAEKPARSMTIQAGISSSRAQNDAHGG
jgi:hypothetical protein